MQYECRDVPHVSPTCRLWNEPIGKTERSTSGYNNKCYNPQRIEFSRCILGRFSTFMDVTSFKNNLP